VPLEIAEPLVKYEFMRMPDSTGFGDYTESGQVIPVRFAGEDGVYVHSMYLDDDAPIAGGRELWGFPKKLANPKISHEGEVIVGTLHYGQALCALGTFGYKHRAAAKDAVLKSLRQPNFLLKVIPPRGRHAADLRAGALYHLEDIVLEGSVEHAEPTPTPCSSVTSSPTFARLPVLEIVSGQAPGRGPHAGAWPGRL
jgi:acetoacetate decarboxylase